MDTRRDILKGLAASGIVLALPLPRRAWAGTHYAFVKFEATGTTLGGDDAAKSIIGELPRAEWIQCKRVSYGLKRDIGTGARVSGHTHYDRIEFDCSQGPSTPISQQLQTVQKHKLAVNATLQFYGTASREGRPQLQLAGPGWIDSVEASGRLTSATFYFTEPVSSDLAEKAASWTAE